MVISVELYVFLCQKFQFTLLACAEYTSSHHLDTVLFLVPLLDRFFLLYIPEPLNSYFAFCQK